MVEEQKARSAVVHPAIIALAAIRRMLAWQRQSVKTIHCMVVDLTTHEFVACLATAMVTEATEV